MVAVLPYTQGVWHASVDKQGFEVRLEDVLMVSELREGQ